MTRPSTFLGHPLACAAGLAMLDLLEAGLDQQAERLGTVLPAGDRAQVVELTPPACLTAEQTAHAVAELKGRDPIPFDLGGTLAAVD